jgi:hypothetical protein
MRAVALPIPVAPPLIIATLSGSSNLFINYLLKLSHD